MALDGIPSRFLLAFLFLLLKVKTIPCWMFLDWTNQIVAVIDKAIQMCVAPILNNIARSYPQSLMYPLRVSKEQFVFDESVTGRKMRKYFEE